MTHNIGTCSVPIYCHNHGELVSRFVVPKERKVVNTSSQKCHSAASGGYGNRSDKASAWLAPDGNGLKLEMTAPQQCGCSDKFAGGQVFGGEVGAVNGVEFVEQR